MARWRRILALAAALAAGLAAVMVFEDRMIVSHEFVTTLPIVLGSLAAVLAVWPSGRDWSSVRRWLTGMLAAIWVFVGFYFVVFVIAVAGCACPSTGADYVPPAPLGIDARVWAIVGYGVAPVLLFVAAIVPGKKDTAPTPALDQS